MAYRPPSVEVTQVQQTASPQLFERDLPAINVGLGQYQINLDDYTYSTPVVSGISQTYTIQVPSVTLVEGEIESDSIFVRLIQKSGDYVGSTFSLSLSHDSSVLTYLNGQLTVDLAGLPTALQSIYDNCNVEIGCRMNRYDLDNVLTLESFDDIRNQISGNDPDIFNKLAFASYLSMSNAQGVIHAYGVNVSGTTESLAFAAAISELENAEVYGMVPLSATTSVLDAYVAHAESMSLPVNKKERIIFQSRDIVWYDSGENVVAGPSLADKTVTARKRAEASFANNKFRDYWLFPDTLYHYQELPVGQCSREYIEDNLHPNMTAYGIYPQLAGPYVGTSGRRYFKYANLTEAVYDDLRREYESLEIFVPAPSYYYGSMTVGAIERYDPEKPFNSLALAGGAYPKFSNEFFSNTQLNLLGAGGNYIFVQANKSSPVVCRDQLSTDMRTAERAELSINKTIDYVAKFVRAVLEPFKGIYNIDEEWIKLAGNTVSGAGTILKRKGRIKDFEVQSVTQDDTEPRRTYIKYRIYIKYPNKWTDIDLIF